MVALRNGWGKVAPAPLRAIVAFGFELLGCDRKIYAPTAPTSMMTAIIATIIVDFNFYSPCSFQLIE